jgi:hypothetical protein
MEEKKFSQSAQHRLNNRKSVMYKIIRIVIAGISARFLYLKN